MVFEANPKDPQSIASYLARDGSRSCNFESIKKPGNGD
jgi:hypothetical protein